MYEIKRLTQRCRRYYDRLLNPATTEQTLFRRLLNMAEQEEDFSSLPLPDRFQHKVSTGAMRLLVEMN
jgi:hypothetical protein